MRKRSRLILALDETDERKALEVADSVGDLVDAIKINWPLVLSTSPEIITRISRSSEVICDFKVADIPNTNKLIVCEAVKRGASGVIVHAFTGSDSVTAAVTNSTQRAPASTRNTPNPRIRVGLGPQRIPMRRWRA